jgi:hypothetical protein
MVKTFYESRYLLINFITEHKFLIYSLDSSLSKLNQITLTRRPISSLYFLKLLKEIYNVNSNTIIGITGAYTEKCKYYLLLYGFCVAHGIRIRKLDFYQACERVNFRYKILNATNKLIDWLLRYNTIYDSIIEKKSIKFIDSEFLNIIENRSKKEKILFKKSLLLLMYIYLREELYNYTKKCILKNKKNDVSLIQENKTNINILNNKLYIIK